MRLSTDLYLSGVAWAADLGLEVKPRLEQHRAVGGHTDILQPVRCQRDDAQPTVPLVVLLADREWLPTARRLATEVQLPGDVPSGDLCQVGLLDQKPLALHQLRQRGQPPIRHRLGEVLQRL